MIIAYTDGSCTPNPGKGGWAFIALIPPYEVIDTGSSRHTTNNIMELTAIIKVIETFSKETEFHIFSDSQYAINGATGKHKRKKNLDLWREYDTVSKGKKIEFTWVKGHNNDPYNERVDKLAKNTS